MQATASFDDCTAARMYACRCTHDHNNTASVQANADETAMSYHNLNQINHSFSFLSSANQQHCLYEVKLDSNNSNCNLLLLLLLPCSVYHVLTIATAAITHYTLLRYLMPHCVHKLVYTLLLLLLLLLLLSLSAKRSYWFSCRHFSSNCC
jgi:hypothetical protein